MIVHIPEHGAALQRQWPENARPELELVRTVYLDAGVIDDGAVRTHPSYVNEIGGRLSSKLHHLLTRNPSRVGERERHGVLGEQREDSFVNPAALAKLDRELKVT